MNAYLITQKALLIEQPLYVFQMQGHCRLRPTGSKTICVPTRATFPRRTKDKQSLVKALRHVFFFLFSFLQRAYKTWVRGSVCFLCQCCIHNKFCTCQPKYSKINRYSGSSIRTKTRVTILANNFACQGQCGYFASTFPFQRI